MSTLHRVLTVLLAKGWMPERLERNGNFALNVTHLQLADIAKEATEVPACVLHFRRHGTPLHAKLTIKRGATLANRASTQHLSDDVDAAIAQVTIPGPQHSIWDIAPEGATHWDTQRLCWYKTGPGNNCMAHRGSANNNWYRSSFENEMLDSKRFVTRPEPEESVDPETDGLSIYLSKFAMTTTANANLPVVESRPMKVVMCSFADGSDKEYAYWAPADAKAGDYGVIYANKNIVQSREMPFAIVHIINSEVLDSSKATKALLGTFNEDFAKHVETRIQHMAAVRTKLALKKKAFEEGAFYEMMAKNDPEAAALLEELKQFRM
jgi:hypothetical protein